MFNNVRIGGIEFAFKEEIHIQFFGQVVVYISAVQQERTATAKGSIVVLSLASGDTGSSTTDVTAAAKFPVKRCIIQARLFPHGIKINWLDLLEDWMMVYGRLR